MPIPKLLWPAGGAVSQDTPLPSFCPPPCQPPHANLLTRSSRSPVSRCKPIKLDSPTCALDLPGPILDPQVASLSPTTTTTSPHTPSATSLAPAAAADTINGSVTTSFSHADKMRRHIPPQVSRPGVNSAQTEHGADRSSISSSNMHALVVGRRVTAALLDRSRDVVTLLRPQALPFVPADLRVLFDMPPRVLTRGASPLIFLYGSVIKREALCFCLLGCMFRCRWCVDLKLAFERLSPAAHLSVPQQAFRRSSGCAVQAVRA